MANTVNSRVSKKLADEIENMIGKVNENFGLELNKVQASKVIAWKSQNSHINLTSKKLLEILGDRDE